MPRRPVALASAAFGLLFCAALAEAQPDAPSLDLFRTASGYRGASVSVPPRALAVIPERHLNRLIRFTDVLATIVPQFDEVALQAGLSSRTAIQLLTQEASIPIFVRKTDATVSTVLQLEIGQRIEVRGVLFERGNRYLLAGSEVRAIPPRRRAP